MLHEQESVGGDTQRRVMMEAAPATALVVAEAEFLLELVVIALDPPSQLGEMDQALDRSLLAQVGEPVLDRLSLALGPFDQQPLLGPRLGAPAIAVGRAQAQGGKARAQRAGHTLAPGDVPPLLRTQALGQGFG